MRPDGSQAGDREVREDVVGGRLLQICGQPEGRDVKSHAEGRQLDQSAGDAEPELAHQIRRKGFGVAERVDIRGRILVSAAVGCFSWERDVGVRAVEIRARLRRILLAEAEKKPVLGAEVLVYSREVLRLQGIQGEIPRPVDPQRGRKRQRRFGVVAQGALP